MNIIDTHAHYDDEAFSEDREMLLDSLRAHGIDMVVNAGSSMETSKTGLRLAADHPFVYCALGVHPNETEQLTETDMDWIRQNAENPRVVAIGEIGLEYHNEEPDRSIQKIWFRRQIALAKECHLPIIVHSRDAARDTLDIIKEEKAAEAGGVIHCFSYGPELARIYLELGFLIGVGGVVTFKNAKKLKEVVSEIPLEAMVLETDSPYLSPEPNRGKRNSSLNLPYVAAEIARIRGITAAEVIDKTRENAFRLFPKLKGQ